MASQLLPRNSDDLPIWRAIVPSESEASSKKDVPKDNEALHSHHLRVPLAMAKGARDVVIPDVDFPVGGVGTKIVHPCDEILP